jgi:hypothetical protein
MKYRPAGQVFDNRFDRLNVTETRSARQRAESLTRRLELGCQIVTEQGVGYRLLD